VSYSAVLCDKSYHVGGGVPALIRARLFMMTYVFIFIDGKTLHPTTAGRIPHGGEEGDDPEERLLDGVGPWNRQQRGGEEADPRGLVKHKLKGRLKKSTGINATPAPSFGTGTPPLTPRGSMPRTTATAPPAGRTVQWPPHTPGGGAARLQPSHAENGGGTQCRRKGNGGTTPLTGGVAGRPFRPTHLLAQSPPPPTSHPSRGWGSGWVLHKGGSILFGRP